MHFFRLISLAFSVCFSHFLAVPTSLLFLLAIGCQQSLNKKSSWKPCPQSKLFEGDSIYKNHLLTRPIYLYDSLFFVNPITRYDSAIVVSVHDGWGAFDNLAVLYNDQDYKAELSRFVGKISPLPPDLLWHKNLKPQGFAGQTKRSLSSSEWKGLLLFIDTLNYWCTDFRANTCSHTSDGTTSTLLVKLGQENRIVTWTDCYPNDTGLACINHCRQMEAIAARVLKLAGYPLNSVLYAAIEHKKKDSLTISLHEQDSRLLENIILYNNGKVLEWESYLDRSITIHKRYITWINSLEVEEQHLDFTTWRYKPTRIIWQ